MATVTLALLRDTKGMADHKAVRRALYTWGFHVNRWKEETPKDAAALLAWVERKSVPTSSLADRILVRRALDACTRRLDGKTSAGSVIARTRAIFHQALGLAVDAELLAENPIPAIKWKAPEKAEEEVDPEAVPDPAQAAALLAGVRSREAAGGTWRPSSGACTTPPAVPGSWHVTAYGGTHADGRLFKDRPGQDGPEERLRRGLGRRPRGRPEPGRAGDEAGQASL
ncbi:hypothetical protein [Streptomyces sp. NPDC055912]|uniref:hypothetical protein n=1 Tax=Streptomyces sp. NPDC055912 TaxID=3345660 RepID=UPI0035D89123